jgi:hypothetical protein
MAQRIHAAINCGDPDQLAAFLAAPLGYELMEIVLFGVVEGALRRG